MVRKASKTVLKWTKVSTSHSGLIEGDDTLNLLKIVCHHKTVLMRNRVDGDTLSVIFGPLTKWLMELTIVFLQKIDIDLSILPVWIIHAYTIFRHGK